MNRARFGSLRIDLDNVEAVDAPDGNSWDPPRPVKISLSTGTVFEVSLSPEERKEFLAAVDEEFGIAEDDAEDDE